MMKTLKQYFKHGNFALRTVYLVFYDDAGYVALN